MKDKNDLKDVRVAFFFKDLAAWTQCSCVGLHVAGFTTAKYLKHHGVHTVVYPVRHNIDVVQSIDKYNENNEKKLTHVIISAPWLTLYELKCLIEHFSNIQFVILSHSNVGFLQADPSGMELLRKYAELSLTHSNLRVGGNSRPFAEWFEIAYNYPAVCLPNLYSCHPIKHKMWNPKNVLKIGAFGAIRAEKNFMTAAAAALAIKSLLNVPLEFHMLSGGEKNNSMTIPAIKQMMDGLDNAQLIRHEWQTWDKFIHLVEKMDLLISPSYTESFHMITCDGISVGVPSVVSPVIRWAPSTWKADPDNALDVAKTGIYLLQSNQEELGAEALEKHNKKALKNWVDYLINN